MKYDYYLYVLILSLISCEYSKSQHEEYDLIIKDVTIYNSVTKQIERNKTICIKGDTISKVYNSEISVKGKNLIDGTDRLIIPGFIDTHVHLSQIFGDGNEIAVQEISDSKLYSQVLKEQYLKYGTTTILDLGQPERWLPVTTKWQNNPSPEIPNVFNAGGALRSDNGSEVNMNHAAIFDKEHAAIKIKQYADSGLRHLKIYSFLKKEDMKNVLVEAQKHSIIPFAHIDRGDVQISKGIDMGIRNFEHFFTVINAILDTEEHWIKLNQKYKLRNLNSSDEWTANLLLYFKYIESNPELSIRLIDLFKKLSSTNSSLSMTIHPLASIAAETDIFSSFQTFPLRSKAYFPVYDSLKKEELKNGFKAMMRFVRAAHEQGVDLRIGTDCRYGGQALITELKLLVEAGISIYDVFQIATYNGAIAMGIDDKYGIIESGKVADLVLFDKNPLDDFNNINRAKTIIKMGQVVTFKEPITHDLYEQIIQNGIESGIHWYQNSEGNEKYYSEKKSQVMEVGYSLLQQRRVRDAITIFKFCKQEFSDYKLSYNWINEEQLDLEAFVINKEGKTKLAIELLLFNAELFPNSWSVYNSLGELYYQDKQISNAILNFEKSLKLNPLDERAKIILSRLKKSKG